MPKASAEKASAPVVLSTPFASPAAIKLGMTVRDPATNLVGQADMKCELLSGTTQYAIQPKGDGKTIPERYYVDDFLLEFVDDGISARVPTPDGNDPYSLGEKLEDTVTGYTGIATQRSTFLNGCVHYHLQRSLADTKGKTLLEELPQGASFDYKRLKTIGKGVSQKDEATGEPVKTPKAKTGGPTTLAPSRMAPSRRV